MLTRFLIAALYFFGIAAAVAIAVALLAPIDAIRFLGVVALACAGAGFLVQLEALQRFDPHAFMVLTHHFRAALRRLRALGARIAGTVGGAPQSTSSRSVR